MRLTILFLLLLTPMVSAYPITKLSPQFDSYKNIGSTGNESCWADVSIGGKEGRQITINTKPVGKRVCCLSTDIDGSCLTQTVDAPDNIVVQLENKTIIFNLEKIGSVFTFSIPKSYDSWLKRFKIGFNSIYFGQVTNYDPVSLINTTQRDSDGQVWNIAFLNMSNDTDQNLWGYYPREEDWIPSVDGTSATIADDVSRNNRQADVHCYGACILDNGYTPSPYGLAWRATSASNPNLAPTYITLGNNPENVLSKGENYTIMFWFNNTLSGGATRTLIKQGGASSLTASQQTYRVEQSTDGNITITLGNGSTSQQIVRQINGSSSGIPVEQWHYFAMSGNTSAFIAYVDGINLTAIAGNVRNMTKPYYSQDNTTIIGASRTSLSNEAFDGAIDEIMYFNRTMNASEIDDYYKNRSNRYRYDGTMQFTNINLSGNDSVVITANTTTLAGTYINVSINGGQEYGINTTNSASFTYTGTTEEANITFHFYPNKTGGFYYFTPYIRGVIAIDSEPSIIAPTIANLTEFPTDPGNWSPGFTLQLNATIFDNVLGLNSLNLEFDGVNQSLTQNGDVYTADIPLVVFTQTNYTYYWSAENGGGIRTFAYGNYTLNFVPLTNFSGNLCIGFFTQRFPQVNLRSNLTCTN